MSAVGVKTWHLPSETVHFIASAAIQSYLVHLGTYGDDPDTAELLAVKETVEGCAVDLEAIERQMAEGAARAEAAAKATNAWGDDLPF